MKISKCLLASSIVLPGEIGYISLVDKVLVENTVLLPQIAAKASSSGHTAECDRIICRQLLENEERVFRN